ncbi:hypothetical protein [Plantactinospora soyae]|uniref:Uncharacterized protein n=1 Tax=Plantactinospora soyae TaxID=1544732 RepID=A0A927RAM5_9ACTN|nr:hypothetical protein [Plantactinospora soyae]MBE1490876.1 hypothetical protein [Plantactinospora soyae]
MSEKLSTATIAVPSRTPTVWTRRLQLFTAVASVLTTVGTAIVLGYVTSETIQPAWPDKSPADIDGFLLGWRAVGIIFLIANAVGILALWDRAWIFYFMLVLNVIQGIGFLTVDRHEAGLRDLGNAGSILTDGGGGIVALVLLGFLVRYRTAWAYQRA